MHFNILDAREVPYVTDPNDMLKDTLSCSHLPYQHQNRNKLNHGRVTRCDELVLRKAVSYEKYHSTKQRTFCSSVAVTV